MKFIDDVLNKITMYKLVFYELIGLLVVAAVLGYFHLVPYNPLFIAYSTVVIFAVAWVVNKIFAYFFEAPSNPESTYITGLILALIISPAQTYFDAHFLSLALWASAIAVASKYIFAFKEKHIFNPAAFGVAATALFLNQGASWWVGTLWMLPFIAVGGFLVARKIRRLDLVIAFGASIIVSIFVLSLGEGSGALHIVKQSLLYSPAVFLGTVMLTEPLTTPPTRFLRIWYGILVGFLFAPEVHIGSFYFTPELALLTGNIFVYLVSPKVKLLLTLKERIPIAADTYEFVFSSDRKLRFKAGQYLEWTYMHAHADGRGIRRYFTIASSPTERDYRIGVKFYKPSSSYKKAMLDMKRGDQMVASQLAGDFTLPNNKKKKLVFIAGGIGITPFRSMLQYLLDKQEKRKITIIYSNKSIPDVAYAQLLDRAERELGVETIPVITNQTPEMLAKGELPSKIDKQLIMSIPGYQDCLYYISGPHGMIMSFQDLLKQMGIPQHHIKEDFFPGFV